LRAYALRLHLFFTGAGSSEGIIFMIAMTTDMGNHELFESSEKPDIK
jgi:hypothetical protein